MRNFSGMYLAGTLGLAALVLGLCTGRGVSQDPNLKPNYGVVNLKAGFEPDPVMANVDAGGAIQTGLGGVKAWVDKAPDFRVNYTAGEFPLTFYVKSDADTTLLINLPDGKWVANDDGPDTGLDPLIKFTKPQSGQYDIWVGTLEGGKTPPPAKLYVTELK